MVIEAGSYDQTELPPLDCQPGTNRVLSSFVKMMRIDQMTGKGQFARFLSELILAEESSDEWHDSNSFLGTEQRYKRIDFVKLMKRHLTTKTKSKHILQRVVKSKRVINQTREKLTWLPKVS